MALHAAAMDKQPGDNDGSVISGLTDMDDDTDEFGRQVLQHVRDEQRISQAVQGNGQAFSRARPRPRIALTLDNLERNELASGRNSPDRNDTNTAPDAGSSNGSEPPLNIPREWGRKARQGNGWLSRIRDTEKQEVHVVQEQVRVDGDLIYARKTAYTGDDSVQIDWAAEADSRPLSAPDGTPPSVRRGRHLSASPSVIQRDLSVNRIKEWESDQDLTAASLLASTPAVPSRNTALEEIRKREIQGIEQRGVASSRLDQIRKRTLTEAWQRKAESNREDSLEPEAETASTTRHNTSRNTPALEAKQNPRRKNAVSDKENRPLSAPPSTTSILASKPSDTSNIVRESVGTTVSSHVSRAESRPGDPLSLLRKLARASSSSPPREPEQKRSEGLQKTSAETVGGTSGRDQLRQPRGGKAGMRGHSAAEATPITNRTLTSAKTPVVTGAWIATPGPRTEIQSSNSVRESTTRQHSNEVSTFRLATETQETNKASSPIRSTQERESSSKRTRPASALSDLVRDARLDQQNTLGDSTINSLEDLLDPTIEASQTLDLGDLQEELNELHDDGRPMTQGDKDRRQELLAIEAMNKRLRVARSSIQDASRGLRRVEQSVDAAADTTGASHKHVAEFGTCATCGRHTSVFRALWEEFCGLFFVRDKTRRLGLRLTRLGAICMAFWVWYITENILCSLFCQPRYAYTMTGYGVNPDAPRYPFVLPTLIFRPFRWLWQPALQSLAWCFGVLFSYMKESWASDGGTGSFESTVTEPGFEYYYGGADWNNVDWVSRLGMLRKGHAIRNVKWFSSSREFVKDTAWSKGHLERGNVWSNREMEWEAGPETLREVSLEEVLGSDSMGDDELI